MELKNIILDKDVKYKKELNELFSGYGKEVGQNKKSSDEKMTVMLWNKKLYDVFNDTKNIFESKFKKNK